MVPSPASGANGGDELELTCSNGHRTTHPLARALRLNDAWCGKCGVDIGYTDPALLTRLLPDAGCSPSLRIA